MAQCVTKPFAGSLNSTIPWVHGSWPPKNVFAIMMIMETAIFTDPKHLSPRKMCPRLQHVAWAHTAIALVTDKLNRMYQAKYY
ncbi:hypothetical protein MAM1_0269d08996 [Mucor ambiguus]|uniref:Uncharacterized protein n=1 Tax=Mucor ambiguus TaxID=91626 RepID=A0A0C9N0N0_9FUNG|nr:hypothetical protein MAM1_0269d08996 [Mucor ambiguus]